MSMAELSEGSGVTEDPSMININTVSAKDELNPIRALEKAEGFDDVPEMDGDRRQSAYFPTVTQQEEEPVAPKPKLVKSPVKRKKSPSKLASDSAKKKVTFKTFENTRTSVEAKSKSPVKQRRSAASREKARQNFGELQPSKSAA